jgi:hypothetical protein
MMMRTEMVLEMLVHLLFNHLVCLPAWESFKRIQSLKASDYIPSSELAYENQTKNDLQQKYSASIAHSILCQHGSSCVDEVS